MKEYILPERIIASEGVDTRNLLKKQPLQIGLAERETTVFEDGQYVILDFGEEMCGGVRILTYHSMQISVRVRFGESLSECQSELGGKTNATNDHSSRDFTVNLPNYSDMTFGNTGFRFVRLDFSGHVRLKSVLAVRPSTRPSRRLKPL